MFPLASWGGECPQLDRGKNQWLWCGRILLRMERRGKTKRLFRLAPTNKWTPSSLAFSPGLNYAAAALR